MKEIFRYLLGPPYFKYIPTIFFPGFPSKPETLSPKPHSLDSLTKRASVSPGQGLHQRRQCEMLHSGGQAYRFVAKIDPEAEIEVGVNIYCAVRSQLVAKPMLAANIRCQRAGPVLLQGISSIALCHQWLPLRSD